ncbi:MAG TPA: XRE family transcriptional regulator [Ruminococcaceae bacterium]|nr:XRE family transcriptional regulator [Oscillospiraceae bacterium]
MIFADKLILLRKKAGWSQEELAEQMNVTRQSVSKWEGAQSVPDLEKMIRLSELFGVSTDYLLKDDMEEAEHIRLSEDMPSLKRVSMEEANAFLSVKARTAKTIAYAVFLCILSPITLLILGAISESASGVLNENIAGGIGMIVLILFVATAVVLFISSGSKTAPFAYLEKEKFEAEYGVSGMVKERKAQYKDLHTKNTIAGTCLCITALIPLFVGAIIDADNDLFLTIMLSFSLLIAGVGVICFIKTGILWASFEKLLQEGEYSKENKGKPSFASAIYTAYWIITTAVYSGYSMLSNNWGQSWIIWAVAGILFPAVVAITNAIEKKSK